MKRKIFMTLAALSLVCCILPMQGCFDYGYPGYGYGGGGYPAYSSYEPSLGPGYVYGHPWGYGHDGWAHGGWGHEGFGGARGYAGGHGGRGDGGGHAVAHSGHSGSQHRG